MTEFVELDAWTESIIAVGASVDRVDGEVRVTYDGQTGAHPTISLQRPVESVGRVRVVVATGPVSDLSISGGGEQIELDIRASDGLVNVRLGSEVGGVTIAKRGERELSIEGVGQPRLSLGHGYFRLNRQKIQWLVLEDSEVRRPQSSPDILVLEVRGSATLREVEWVAGTLILRQANDVTVDANRRLLAESIILPVDRQAPVFSGHFVIGPVDIPTNQGSGGALRLADGAMLELVGSVARLSISGRGVVKVHDEMIAGHFSGSEIAVECLPRGRLLDARGTVARLSGVGAVISGARAQPIRPASIVDVEGSVLLNVDCFDLSEDSLGAIEELAQFSPWVPPRSSSAVKELRSMHLAQDKATEKWRRARFWQRLSRLSSEAHASGNTQSQVRFVYGAARRDAAESMREKILLWAYSAIGYGERVLLPLFWYLVVVVLVWSALSAGILRFDGSYSLIDMFGLPLQFFRILGDNGAQTYDPGLRWLLVAVQLFGLVMLFFSLSAVRRVSKAE